MTLRLQLNSVTQAGAAAGVPEPPAEAGNARSRSQHADKWLPHQEACKPSVETCSGCTWEAAHVGHQQPKLCKAEHSFFFVHCENRLRIRFKGGEVFGIKSSSGF